MKWTKESSYFFGYLWSDGFIERQRTILEIVEEDAIEIIDEGEVFIPMGVYHRLIKGTNDLKIKLIKNPS